MKVRTMTTRLSTTMRASPGLKQLAFWRRTISSIRGCCHLPGVIIMAGEPFGVPEGVAGLFCGVILEIGCAATFLILLAGD